MRNHIVTFAAALSVIVIFTIPIFFHAIVIPVILMLLLNVLGYAVGFGTCFLTVYLFRWAIYHICKSNKTK